MAWACEGHISVTWYRDRGVYPLVMQILVRYREVSGWWPCKAGKTVASVAEMRYGSATVKKCHCLLSQMLFYRHNQSVDEVGMGRIIIRDY